MAPCAYCGQDRSVADGCTDIPIQIHGSLYRPVPYGDDSPFDPNRWDCDDLCTGPLCTREPIHSRTYQDWPRF